MTEYKRMRQRSGTYSELEAASSSLLQDEMFVVHSGDDSTTDGKSLYMNYANNDLKRLRFASEEIGTDDIADEAITNDLMAEDSVGTDNIINGSITPEKFDSSVGFGSGYSFICSDDGKIVAYSPSTSRITTFYPTGYIVPARYYIWLAKSVTSIASGLLPQDSSHILERVYAENPDVDLSTLNTTGVSVLTGYSKEYKKFVLASLSLPEDNIAEDSIDTQHIRDGAITPDQLDGGAVDLTKINSSTYESTPTNGSSKLLTSGGAYAALYHKMGFRDYGSSVFAMVDEEGKVFQLTYSGVKYYSWIIGDIRYRASVNGLEYQELINDTWSDWQFAIADNSVSYNSLTTNLQNDIDGKLPYQRIVKDSGGVAVGVDLTYLNSLTFDRKTFYYVWFAVDVLFRGSPREWCVFLELEADYQIAIRPNGDVYYRQYSNAQWSNFKNKITEINDNYGSESFIHINNQLSRLISKTWDGKIVLTIPGGVQTITDSCFRGNNRIQEANISSDVREIDFSAFRDCTELKKVNFNNSPITTIPAHCFQGCSSLTEISFPSNLRYLMSDFNYWGSHFSGCTSLEEVVLPDTVEYIGREAFAYCSNLETVHLSTALTYLGYLIFKDCAKLKTINIPASLTTIDDSTFNGCINLENVTIENGFNCNNLKLSASTKYSYLTLESMVNALADRSGQTAYTLRVGLTALINNGNITQAQADYLAGITTAKNWNLV